MNLERILKQHKEILKLSNKLEEYINKLEVQNSDKNLLSEILLKKSFLMGKLKVHLLTEEILYSLLFS
jgi:hemerythrin